mgnify:CR=1 FL=1
MAEVYLARHPTQIEQLIYIAPTLLTKRFTTLQKAAVPPKCGASGAASTGYYFGNLLEETLGAKFNTLTGYKDGPLKSDLAVEREEIHCRGISIETMFGREPLIGWFKNGFVGVLIQTGKKRDPRLRDVPTIWELMNEQKDSRRRHETPSDDHPRSRRVRPAVHPSSPPRDCRRTARKASPERFQKNSDRPGFFRPKPENEN